MMMQALTRRNTWGILQECRLLTSPLRPLSTAPIKRSCQPSSQHSHGCSRLFSEKLFARCLSSGPVASPADLRSTVPDVEIPNVSFAEFICNRCDQFKDRIALVSDRSLSLSSSHTPNSFLLDVGCPNGQTHAKRLFGCFLLKQDETEFALRLS